MKIMKQILFFFFTPVLTWGQTVHIEKDRIAYQGTVYLASIGKVEIYERAKGALSNSASGKGNIVVDDNEQEGRLAMKGKIRLTSPYYLRRNVEYIIELTVKDGSYNYRIDSVYLEQRERGGGTTRASSEELLKGMDITGKESVDAEKWLNEIDMNFQKLIALINSSMKKQAIATGKERE